MRGTYSIVIHEFAHAIQNICFKQDEHIRWDRFYRNSQRDDLFPWAYGMTDSGEFFAEFTVSYFDRPNDSQRHWDPGDDELTRQKLSADFPEIFSFLKEIYEGWDVGDYFSPDLGFQDRDTLVAFYNSAGGPNWVNSENWLSDKPLEEWYGVTVGDNRRVAELKLAKNGLSGAIPPELGALASMWNLDLEGNQLIGKIPDELSKSKLYALSLGGNKLSGEIPPELGKLSLWWLSLRGNQLTGQIPSELADLPNLGVLWLSGNPLSGCIPAGLRDIRSNDLDKLNLQDC